ncbi:hypothetical protein [Hymenobacter canadensis]|uniref:Uncharacterized protein n=1 Tax=Hymenobacter canadensis TaxID=2999067 RepID=A0ABY7LS78_9BACT|nr:hypothetical protein [Hymenobacter canadensis]WBA41753.1 hypothetical protein O3303_18320 [Hymenobacter canadensis]
MKNKHNIGLLRFVFKAYIPSLKNLRYCLDNISESFKWDDIQISHDFEDTDSHLELSNISRSLKPGLEEYWLLFLGIAELATVCEEVAIEFEDSDLIAKIEDLKKDFPFKTIRDIIAHWEEYSIGKGRLQHEKNSPSVAMLSFPFMSAGGSRSDNYYFELAGKNINIYKLYEQLESLCDEVRHVLYAKH